MRALRILQRQAQSRLVLGATPSVVLIQRGQLYSVRDFHNCNHLWQSAVVGDPPRNTTDSALLEFLENLLVEENLSAEQRELMEATARKITEGQETAWEEMQATIVSNVASEAREVESADTAAFLTRITENVHASVELPIDDAISETHARQLFDNLVTEMEAPVHDQTVWERNRRHLQREQKLLDSDVRSLCDWREQNAEALRRYDQEEDKLLQDGADDSDLSDGALFDAPADRIDPLLLDNGEDAEVFEYSWQEMMAADMGSRQHGPDNDTELTAAEDSAKQAEFIDSDATTRVTEVDRVGRSYAVGHKKTAIARLYLQPSEPEVGGQIWVNGMRFDDYFPYYSRWRALTPFQITATMLQYNVNAKVKGGGKSSQLEALRYAIARALQKQDPATRSALKAAMLLTRDARVVERKKPGQKKARKKFTWVKR